VLDERGTARRNRDVLIRDREEYWLQGSLADPAELSRCMVSDRRPFDAGSLDGPDGKDASLGL